MGEGVVAAAEVDAYRLRVPVTEYRIDDLAREAGVSVRNVRVYQDRGLLPPPRKVGRTGWYDESHLARLQMISRMLDRGYTFVTISELLTAAQYGLRVEDVLGTEDPDGEPHLLCEAQAHGAWVEWFDFKHLRAPSSFDLL